MRERPRRERVRAEPLVHQRERRLEVGIGQIGEHRHNLIGNQHPFVDERLRREAGDVERARVGARCRQLVDGVFGALSDDVQLALETRVRLGIVPRLARDALSLSKGGRLEGASAADEHLLEPRFGGDRRCAEQPIVGRDMPPAEQLLPLLADDPLEHAADLFAGCVGMREEDEAGAIEAGGRQRDAERRGNLAQKAVRHLDKDAGAVAGRRFAAARATVQEVDEDAQPLLDDGVRPAAFDVDDEADAAGVVLVDRVVQTDGGRRFLATPSGLPRRGPRRPFLRNAGVGPFAEGRQISCRHDLGTPLAGLPRSVIYGSPQSRSKMQS